MSFIIFGLLSLAEAFPAGSPLLVASLLQFSLHSIIIRIHLHLKCEISGSCNPCDAHAYSHPRNVDHPIRELTST